MQPLDDPYRFHDPRARKLFIPHTTMTCLFDRCLWAEGPVWFADGGYLVWSDIPNDRMLRWLPDLGVDVFDAASNFTNGNTRDREGRLVSCQHGGRRVVRTEPDGRMTVLADRHAGRKLNSPNDVVVKSDHSIWFTDPTYGIMSNYEGYAADPEQDGNHVYRLDARTGELRVVVDDFVQPNGLAFSPDEKLLYVADSGASHDPDAPHHIRVFEVTEDGRLRGGRVFCEVSPGVPDGMRIDTDGNLWTSSWGGIQVWSPDATLLGEIVMPEKVANLTFGGPRKNRLFIAAHTGLYMVYVGISGVQTP